ncbi:DUF1501 domain-containing protein [Adhaeretor mobilis]|uniref:DUF1501 domain-containing protein n=1 Tax=Adhaeretor mobilis TaxID=1930276 RepID=A0A517MRZ8_9BACT|nr:DUF1501 domain-containing protein [Adhaeretor mobilis]QDS97655.1 hypothetical protein HG15A2_09190 [Adhaeretor mobilis]
MNDIAQQLAMMSRRELLKTASVGFGYLAFAGLSTQAAAREAGPLAARAPHFAPRAKRVIFLCMQGGPSHVDTFDYKPKLQANDGKEASSTTFGGTGRARYGKLLGPQAKFRQRGESGLWISDLFPEVAKHADDLCLLRGMHTDVPAHSQAFLQMHTGTSRFVRPSLGSWALYGLGTENANLPGFISLNPPSGQGGAQNYGSAFLPAVYQGTPIRGRGMQGAGAAPTSQVPNIANPQLSELAQRRQLDFIQELNQSKRAQEEHLANSQVDGVISSYELAFRMQDTVPEVMNLAGETSATQAAYGLENRETATFGRQCLLARRFLEAGVRFVEVCQTGWDQHRNLKDGLAKQSGAVDQPIAALLADLKQRDLLKDTLVIWGGEFGRTPVAQGADGRGHNNLGYTMWMAGGGVRSGLSYGETDEYGREAIDGRVHIHDLHATILHLLGFDHKQLTYRYAGRDFRLTDVHGNVVKDILV